LTDSGTTADYSRVTGFVLRRLLSVLPLVWGTATLVFLLVEVAPGDPFDTLREPGVSPSTAIRLHEALGADRPFLVRYVDWLEGLLHGDLGTSWTYRQPAAGLIREAALNTLTLAGPALILQFALGLAAGFVAARSRGGFADRGMSAAAAALYSVPSFCLALPLTWLLAVRLRWLPVSQMHSLDAATLSALPRLLDTARHLVLPCLALVLPTAAGIALYVRDQVRAALDLGFVSQGSVVLRHTHCGAPGCRCHADPPQLHGPYWQWTRRDSGRTVTRRLTEPQARLYQEWITNRRRLAGIVAEMERVCDQAAELLLQEADQSMRDRHVDRTTHRSPRARP